VIEIPYRVSFKEIQESKNVLIALGATTPMRPASIGRGIFGWVLFIGLAIMLFFLKKDHPAKPLITAKDIAPNSHSFWPIVLFLCGIAGVFIGFAMLRRVQRYTELRTFNAITLWILKPDGMEQISGPKRTIWHWQRFSSFAETDSLFVLRETPQAGQVLPKRLIPDPQTLERVRAMLVEHILKSAPEQA
jgi:hypothetical protein